MNNTEGRILPAWANAISAFRHAPEWGGVLAFNEFAFGTVALKPTPVEVVTPIGGCRSQAEQREHNDRESSERR